MDHSAITVQLGVSKVRQNTDGWILMFTSPGLEWDFAILLRPSLACRLHPDETISKCGISKEAFRKDRNN